MARDTSIDVYHRIERDGVLSRRRWQVYSTLFKHGPLTGTQLSQLVRKSFGDWCMSETIRNRLTELRDMGVVDELKMVECPVNGNRVILWDVNSKYPKKLEIKDDMTQKQAAKIIVEFLQWTNKEELKKYPNVQDVRNLYKWAMKKNPKVLK